MRVFPLVLLCLMGLLYTISPTTAQSGVKWRPEIVIAYPLTFNAWKLAIFKGTFERVTGWTIKARDSV